MNEALKSKIANQVQMAGSCFFPPVDPLRVLDCDGDYLAYAMAGGDDTAPGMARKALLDRVETTRVACGAGSVMMHLSAPGCTKALRFFIATVKPYQGQRVGSAKPKNWEYLRDVMTFYQGPLFTPRVWATREADDGIALMSKMHDGKRVISTRDKDMRMLPGTHVDWLSFDLINVPVGAFEVVGSNGLIYGHKWFWLQMLQGDTADNIPGLPFYVENDKNKKIGDKTAEKFLATAKNNLDAYLIVKALYESYYGSRAFDAMAEQAGLLWLRTDAAASIGNCGEPFPGDQRIHEAIDRLRLRVEGEMNALNQRAS